MRCHPRAGRLAAFPVALVLLLLTLPAMPVAAQTPCDSHAGRLADLNSREELKAFVHCAAAHIEMVGWEQAEADFAGSDWRDDPVFLFAGGDDQLLYFSIGSDLPAGTDMSSLQDSEGVQIAAEMERIALDFGEGYVYYRFLNRLTGQEEPKVSFIKVIERDGAPAVLGAGYHPPDAHGTCYPETVRAALVYDERDLEAYVNCAAHHLQQVGLRALHDFQHDPRWISGPTYLVLVDLETLHMVAHAADPRQNGADTSALSDPDGVNFPQEIRRILSSHDDGYAYFRILNPASNEVEPKQTYLRRVMLDGRAYFLGAGLYVPADDCRNLPPARDIDTRDELQLYVRCAAQLVAGRGELAWDLLLHHPQWIGGPAYVFVLDDQCRQLVYPLDYERQENDEPRCHVTDANGFPANEEIRAIARSEAGEGWVEYVWLNPASDEVETKLSFVVGASLAGEPVSIGAGLYESELE